MNRNEAAEGSPLSACAGELSNLLQECLGHGGRERMQREAKRQVLGTAHPMSQKAKRAAKYLNTEAASPKGDQSK